MDRRIKTILIFGGDYEASENGTIYSLKRGTRKLLIGKVCASGYRMVVITIGRKKQYHYVHRVIATAFLPNPNKCREVNHKDGNKLNNSANNLEWVTPRQNQLHAINSGLRPELKLDIDKAKEIRRLYATGLYTQRRLAQQFNISKTLVSDIINNKRWITKE